MVHSISSGSSEGSTGSPTKSEFDVSKLLNRPPTPPRESTRASSPLKDSSESRQSAILSTPTSSNESIDRPKKRVEWSPWTDYHRPDDPSPLRPSKPDGTPLKSILKPFNPSIIPIGTSDSPNSSIKPYSHGSFSAMLESITQALASTERSKKLDTYVTFSNTLKAYDDKPDFKALRNKMPLLSSFIRRDLFAKMPNSVSTSNDSQLIQQAIKLLTILVWLPNLAESIDEEEAIFFVQHATQVVKDPQSPKILVTNFMNFLASQKFPPRVMTADRADAVISALQDIEERTTGNTVVTERIAVYHRLIQQAKLVMIMRVADWMQHVLAATLSGNKELRHRANICMTEAARTLGSEKSVARAICSLFNREDSDGTKLFDKVKERLEQFTKNGEGIHVAQFWGLIVLLLRGRPPVTSWEYFNPWLQVIQQCFNSSTITTKIAANTAWGKLIYVLHCGPELTVKNMDLLTKPVARYLDPQNASFNSKGPRQAALSNICALLYYNLRPNAPQKHISLTWDLVVVSLIEKLVLFGKHEVEDGCRILAALFDGTNPKPWNELRGLEKEPVKVEELIRVDPKWVKSNSALVLKTIEVAIRRSSWKGDDPAAQLLWRKFTKSLADASSKEVKISAETMETVAHIFNMLRRLWRDGPAAFVNADKKSPEDFMEMFTFLVTATFDALGTLCFTEKQLSFDEHNEFVAVSTPSRFSSEASFTTTFHAPIVHLFQLFLKPFHDEVLSKGYFDSAKVIISRCMEAEDSRRKKISLLSACSSVLPQRGASETDLKAWTIIASLTEKALPISKEKSHLSPTPVTWEFKDVVKILQWGCRYSIPAWGALFDTFVQTAQIEQGDVQMISTVIEPLADILRLEKLDSNSPAWLVHGKTILERAPFPKSRSMTENVSRLSYGVHSRKNASTGHYDNLYDMIDQFLSAAYAMSEDTGSLFVVNEFIVTVAGFISRCPPSNILLLLRRIQNGVAVWLADAKNLLTKDSVLTLKLQDLWSSITDAITKLPHHDSLVLQSITILIASGLESTRKAIVNRAIKTWNDTFGKQMPLEYPARVRLVMKKLRPVADINLPTFPEDIEEIVPTPPVWADSQESADLMPDQNLWSSPTPAPSRRRDRTSSPIMDSLSSTNKSFLARLQDAKTKTPAKTPKARLKHMDSQLEFAPIESETADSNEVDSQLLTEHQKEVRQRQHEQSAAYFSGMTSDRPKNKIPIARLDIRPSTPEQRPQPVLREKSPQSDVDEFVDAPEVIDPGAELDSNKNESTMREVDFVPSTAFIVQVPVRPRPEMSNSEGSDGHEESDDDAGLTNSMQGNSKKVKSLELSKHFTASRAPRRAKERSKARNENKEGMPEVEPNNIPATLHNKQLPGIFSSKQASGQEERNSETDHSVHSAEIYRISASPADDESNEAQDPESPRHHEHSITEVPDSYIPNNEGDHPDITMVDTEHQEEHKQVEIANPSVKALTESMQDSIQDETSTREGAAEGLEAGADEEAPESKSRKAKPTTLTSTRRSSRVKTKPLKLRIIEQEEAMLDCIMVDQSPRLTSGPQFPSPAAVNMLLDAPNNKTPVTTPKKCKDEGSPVKSAEKSPGVRKRKSRNSDAAEPASVDEPSVEPEARRPSRPRKRRATESAKPTAKAEPQQTPTRQPAVRTTRSPIPASVPAPVPAASTGNTKSKSQVPPTRHAVFAESPTPRRLQTRRVRKSEIKMDEAVILDSQSEITRAGREQQREQQVPQNNQEEAVVMVPRSFDDGGEVIRNLKHAKLVQMERQEEPTKEGEVTGGADNLLDPLSRLKETLDFLQNAELPMADLRDAEDFLFDTYLRLREKRRSRSRNI